MPMQKKAPLAEKARVSTPTNVGSMKENVESKASLSNLGEVVSVRGGVVDARFDERLPPIYSVLRSGAKKQIVIKVLAQIDAHRSRRSTGASPFSSTRGGSSPSEPYGHGGMKKPIMPLFMP